MGKDLVPISNNGPIVSVTIPLLHENEEDTEKISPTSSSRYINKHQRASLRLQKCLLCLNLILVAFNTVFFVLKAVSTSSEVSFGSRFGALPLPARVALHAELKRFKTLLVDNPFVGAPRAELGDARHNLLTNDNIRVSNSDLERLGLDSVRLQNSSDSLASLGAYHGLHCLKKVRQMAYKEHYHANKSAEAMVREIAHADHCVEYLREYIMCHPDLSFITYHWINATAQHQDDPGWRLPTTWDHALHECASWEAIDAWAGERMVDLWDYDQLELPQQGLHYGTGK